MTVNCEREKMRPEEPSAHLLGVPLHKAGYRSFNYDIILSDI